MHWSRGLSAFQRLTHLVESDLEKVRPERRERYLGAIDAARQAVHPANFHQPSAQLAQRHLTDVVFERLDGMDEALYHLGQSITVETELAKMVVDELDNLEALVRDGEPTEIDAFLLEQIGEIRIVLSRYVLYGPEGVEDVVAKLIGGLGLKSFALGGVMPDKAKEKARAAFGFAKLALDGLVYLNGAADAIEWSGSAIQALLPKA